MATPLPGPERAAAAAERVRPALERDLTEAGLRFGDPVFIRAFKEEKQLELWMRRRDTGAVDNGLRLIEELVSAQSAP